MSTFSVCSGPINYTCLFFVFNRLKHFVFCFFFKKRLLCFFFATMEGGGGGGGDDYTKPKHRKNNGQPNNKFNTSYTTRLVRVNIN